MPALTALEKIFFPVSAAFLSVLGHVHTGFLAKAGKIPPDHALKRHGLRRVFSVTSVGYAPPGGELDPKVIAQGHLIVEARLAFEPPPVGCGELAGLDASVGTELGEVLLGQSPGRQSIDELTVYKAMGHACEDLAAASLVYHLAKQDALAAPWDSKSERVRRFVCSRGTTLRY